MSNFSKKIRQGDLPNEEDWTQHVAEGHKRAPSQTPDAFAAYKTTEGLNSYQILACEIAKFSGKDLNIVDLACGDGHLIPSLLPKLSPQSLVHGIDMSESELAIAKQNQKDPRVSFIH